MFCCCCPPFSILCFYSISVLSISVDIGYPFPQTNMADSTSLSKCQRVIDDEENKDDNIDMNAPIRKIACTTQSTSKFSKTKSKELVVLTQETIMTVSFAQEASKSVVLYTSKKKPPLPDVNNFNDNDTSTDKIFSNEEEENSKAGGKTISLLIADLCSSMVF